MAPIRPAQTPRHRMTLFVTPRRVSQRSRPREGSVVTVPFLTASRLG